jgi:anti-sigma factor RsiW
MKHEFELKLQAYLDGELDERQARAVEAQTQSAPEAASLLGELRMTAAALRGNELERTLPETREFYWSKIERAIETQGAAARSPHKPSRLAWLFRYWPQLSGASVAALLLGVALLRMGGLPGPCEDIENPLDDTGTFTFRSEKEQMTLVWVSSGSQAQDEDPESVN